MRINLKEFAHALPHSPDVSLKSLLKNLIRLDVSPHNMANANNENQMYHGFFSFILKTRTSIQFKRHTRTDRLLHPYLNLIFY